MKAASSPTSTCERDFILRAIQSKKRLDDRQTYEYRRIGIHFGVEYGHCEVQLGQTRVLSQVSCEVIEPKANRPTEGQLYFDVEFSPMASPEFETGRMTEYGVELNRYIERCFRESRAVDMEPLCIVAGEKVWIIRVNIHVLDHGGNIADCACIAAIASLAHFRHPAVSVVGEEVTIHCEEEREPVSLSVHHMPICVSFAFFNNGEYLLVDPTDREEAVMDAKMLISMNAHRELCAMQLMGGVSLEIDQILRCSKIALVKMTEITELIQRAVAEDKENRKAGRIGTTHVCSQTTKITRNHVDKTEVDFTEAVQEVEDKMEESDTHKDNNNLNTLQVLVRGEGTAQIGEGGEMQWCTSDNEDDSILEEDNSEKTSKQQTKKAPKAQQITVSDDVDSEEEEVMVVTHTDLGGFQKSSNKVPDTGDEVAKENNKTAKKKRKKQRKNVPVVDLT